MLYTICMYIQYVRALQIPSLYTCHVQGAKLLFLIKIYLLDNKI